MQLIEARNLQLTVFHKSAFPDDDFVANCSLPFDDFFNETFHETGTCEWDQWVSAIQNYYLLWNKFFSL